MFTLLNAQSLVGLAVIIGLCWALSENRRAFPWKLALGAVAVQTAIILFVFGVPGADIGLAVISGAVEGLAAATRRGAQFVFGYLAGGDQPYSVENQGALFVFAFQVLPLILVISALSALLWHWKILKWITRGFGLLFQKTMGLGGASALAVAANIFLGMIESPIVIRAYLDKLTRSELFLLMAVGFATVAGSTMVAYATILAPVLPNAAGHVLVASIVSAPAGVLLARILVPEKPGEGGAVRRLRLGPEVRQRHRRHHQGHGGRPDGGAEHLGHPDRVRGPGGPGQHDARRLLAVRRAGDGRAPAGLRFRAAGLGDGGAVERGRDGRLAAGRQADPDRVRRLHRTGRDPGRRDQRAHPAPDDLCPVRLRQHRLGGDHGHRPVHPDARTARDGAGPGLEGADRRLPGHLLTASVVGALPDSIFTG